MLVFLDNVLRHLETPKSYCRILFVDFSSAFNTIQPHLLIPKLQDINLNKSLIIWKVDFLTNRLQHVRLKNNDLDVTSDLIMTNTGAPQGAVLSPFLFTIYANDCQLKDAKATHLIKFAYDTSLQEMITRDDNEYRKSIDWFTRWCKEHFLLLNVSKT